MDKDPQRQAAAKARAQSLTKDERNDIARKAASARWARERGIPVAKYGTEDSQIAIGDVKVACYVLDNGQRVLTQESFLTSLGRAAKAKGGHGVRTAVDNIPPFLAASNLKPLIDKEISQSTTPIEFITPKGTKVLGYAAELLPEVCRVYLSARDLGVLLPSQQHIAIRADMLVRALASVGIVALVDEATGYQEYRDKRELQALLDKYLKQAYARWAKCFPDDFYREMFRLRGWTYPTVSGAKPGVVGKYTVDIVYQRLAPGLIDELERRNPKDESTGRRKAAHHQWLSDDVGHPALNKHLHAVTGLMRAADDWDQFMRMVDRSFPKKNTQMPLLLDE